MEPKKFRLDRGAEFVNKDLKEFFKNEGIELQLPAPYSPQQNGIAEKKNRSLTAMVARCMLFDENLGNEYWGEAVSTANYMPNRLPTKGNNGNLPYTLWMGKNPSLNHIKIFGSLVPNQKTKKKNQINMSLWGTKKVQRLTDY
ncbi:hypothetical protein JTB14_014974 [Gonioctena quinquepunctata]|nr:hypothetical protein JTB14_014974 [Gonioctena quinquepunctata]